MKLKIPVIAVTMAMAAGLAVATPAQATTGTGATTATTDLSYTQVVELSDRVADGTTTTSDQAWLDANPQIAGSLVDGTQSSIGGTEALVSSSTSVSGLTTRCWTADRYFNARSTLGFLLYRYHTRVNWCENGYTISKSTFYDYFTDVDGTTITNTQNGKIHVLNKPASNHWVAYTGGSFDNCIFHYGCLGTKYPAQQISHYAGRGSVTYQWWNGSDGKGWHHQ